MAGLCIPSIKMANSVLTSSLSQWKRVSSSISSFKVPGSKYRYPDKKKNVTKNKQFRHWIDLDLK